MPINFLTPEFLKKVKKIEKKRKYLLKASKLFAALGIVFLIISFAPSVWYTMAIKVDDFSVALLDTVTGKDDSNNEVPTVQLPEWQPVINTKLSRETKIEIPAILIDSKINESTYQNYEQALKLGIWRIPDFGTPIDRTKPVILAAHRFGYLEWSNLYRRKNSFYNLPKLKAGDIVEITYKQRKYIYEIYGESRGEEIADYSANLILYTCETLNSKVRIFKYARLLQI